MSDVVIAFTQVRRNRINKEWEYPCESLEHARNFLKENGFIETVNEYSEIIYHQFEKGDGITVGIIYE